MRVVGTCLTSLLTLTACLGGGGGGASGGGGVAGFAGVNLPLAADPTSFESLEYRRSGGLEAIGASTLYAAGATGAGVAVGVIDTGIDAANREFAGALHPSAKDLLRDAPLADGSGHGTAVAGLLAARRNDQGMHGAAFDASLLVVRADTPGSCPDACLFSQGSLADATDYAVAKGAKVLNFSLGDAGGLAGSLRRSLSAAAAADRVLVFAAGNTGSASPRQPGRFAATAAARGRGIVVGAVDDDDVIVDFSNRAGSAAEVYLVAPGKSLRTVAVGGGIAVVSGTSAATPLVSGAAADLLSAAPHLSGADVVGILLESARDLGAPGTDAVYGRGMLDLERALQPMGPLRVPEGRTTSGAARPLAASSLVLGDAFGAIVPETGPIMALDSYDRAYEVAAAIVAPPPARHALPALLSRQRRMAAERRDVGDLGLMVQRDGSPFARPIVDASDIVGLAARLPLGERLGLRAMLGEASDGAFDEASSASTPPVRTAGFSDLVAPARLGLDAAAGDGWRLSLDIAGNLGGDALPLTHGRPAASPGGGSGTEAKGRLAAVAIERRSDSLGRWRIGFGQLAEAEGPLGSRLAGAMRVGEAVTRFVDLAATLPLGGRLAAFGRAELGRTDLGDGGGLIGDIAPVWSTAFELGLSASALFSASDGARFSIVQPLRVEAGRMALDLPVARDLGGRVLRERRAVGLAPGGRELDFELSYALDMAGGRLQSAMMLRLEPDHDADAEPELLLGVSYRLAF